MKRIQIVLVLFIALCASLIPAGRPPEAQTLKKHVLFLNSYQNGYAWSDTILEGARKALETSGLTVDLHIEYMDTKRFKEREINDILWEYYKYKYQDIDLDVIIASDNNALSFLMQFQEELFPGVPVVFVGINDFRIEMLHGRDDVTGIVEAPDVSENLRYAQRLHPGLKRVVTVGDQSVTSRAIMNQVRATEPEFKGQLTFEFWDSYTLSQLLERVDDFSDDTVLFFTPFYKGAHGELFTVEEVLEAIYRDSNVLIFSCWEFLLGHGTVGGKVLSGRDQGRQAAGMAVRILKGEPAANIPVRYGTKNPIIFDYNVLQRFSIPKTLLPAGAQLINEPNPFYRVNPQLFWIIVISLGILSVILVLLVINIGQRKNVEEKITSQLAFQEILMNTVPLLVCWKDRAHKYLGANKQFAEFFQIGSPERIMGRSDPDFMPNSTLAEAISRWDRDVLQTGHPKLRQPLRVSGPDGTEVCLEINKVPLHDVKGAIVGTLSTAEDVTLRVNLEKQLLQSQKMEAIGTLAGGIAHDFNNILTSIMNSAELALSDVEEGTMTYRDLERVLRAAQRGSGVVKQILAFSRPSQEGFRATDLSKALREAMDLLRASLPRNISLTEEIQAEDPVVWADPTQIQQVLMNLLTNAFQALREDGGSIHVSLDKTLLDEENAVFLGVDPGEYLRLSIVDDGPGIPPEILDKIFDPFFTTKGKTEGTGLGLAVVHGIIRSHKGGVRVQSQPGDSTRFEIFLPRRQATEVELSIEDGVVSTGDEHILFVEDDQDQLATAPRLLESMGYRVEATDDPAQAVDMVRQDPGRFDLIITDYDMPGTNGLQLARQVERIDNSLPVLMISGRKAASALASDYPNIRKVILKPYGREELSQAIRLSLDDGLAQHDPEA